RVTGGWRNILRQIRAEVISARAESGPRHALIRRAVEPVRAEIDDVPVRAGKAGLKSHRRIVADPIRRVEVAGLRHATKASPARPGIAAVERDLGPDLSALPAGIILIEESVIHHHRV